MLNIVKHNVATRKIVTGSGLFVQVGHVRDLNDIAWDETDGLVLSTDNTQYALEIIAQVRRKEDIRVGLTPIFVDQAYSMPQELLVHTDGNIDLNKANPASDLASAINQRLSLLPASRVNTFEEIVKYKLLGFLYSRQEVLTPFTSRSSRIGYCFPWLDLFYKQEEAIEILKLLENTEQDGLLQKKCLDHIHLCKSCSSSYLNFREICPKCFSIDILVNDMIHHFVCAHVAPEKDFKTDNGLECPKCDKTLRHIGIDYDKPSSVFQCNTCLHEFQNPDMRGFCFDCNTENQLTQLLHKTIGSYTLTGKGEDWLLNPPRGQEEVTADHEAIGLSETVFRLILQQEIQRSNHNQTQSVVGSISFFDEGLHGFNNELKKDLQKEIGKIIKSYLEPADLLSMTAYNHYYFLLPDTTEAHPERLELIRYNLSKLLSDNLKENALSIVVRNESLIDFNSMSEVFKAINA